MLFQCDALRSVFRAASPFLSALIIFFLICPSLHNYKSEYGVFLPHTLLVKAKWWKWGSLTLHTESIVPVASREAVLYPYTGGESSAGAGERYFAHRDSREAFAKALWVKLEAKGEFSPCWKDALIALRMRCDPIDKSKTGRREESLRTRLSFLLAKCDAEEDGRSPQMFYCSDEWIDTRRCVQGLSESAYAIFVQYRLHADVLCAYLQEEIFQQRTEAAVSALHEETIAAVASTVKIEEIEKEVLQGMKESVNLQETSQKALQELKNNVLTMNQEHQDSLRSAQVSVQELVVASDLIHSKWWELHEALQIAAGTALESINQLSNLTVLQLDKIQFTTQSIHEELRELESSQGGLFASFSFSGMRSVIELLLGSAPIIFFTAFPRTAAARTPAMACWFFSTLFPTLLDSMSSSSKQTGIGSRFLFWLSILPWSFCGGVAAAMCIMSTAIFCRKGIFFPCQRESATIVQLLPRDSGSDVSRNAVGETSGSMWLHEEEACDSSFSPLLWFQRRRRFQTPSLGRDPNSPSPTYPLSSHRDFSVAEPLPSLPSVRNTLGSAFLFRPFSAGVSSTLSSTGLSFANPGCSFQPLSSKSEEDAQDLSAAPSVDTNEEHSSLSSSNLEGRSETHRRGGKERSTAKVFHGKRDVSSSRTDKRRCKKKRT